MKIKRYSSGLRIVLEEKKDLDILYFNLGVNVGSKDEEPKIYGISHFLEHMFFKSNKYLNSNQIKTKFDDLGAFINAYTNTMLTCYHFGCLSGVFEQCLQTYSQMLTNDSYNNEELEKERNVIIEEFNMYMDDPKSLCQIKAIEAMYKGSSYEHEVLGTLKSIKSISTLDLIDYKSKFYTPENIIISVAGNISFKKLEKLVKKYMPHLFIPKQLVEYKKIEYIPIKEKTKLIAIKKDNVQSVVSVKIGIGEVDDYQEKIYTIYSRILGGGMSSRFFNIIRDQKGLVYGISAGLGGIGNNDNISINFSTTADKVKDVLAEIRKILKQCAEGDIKEEEISKIKNKLKSSFEFSKEQVSNLSSRNLNKLFYENKIKSRKQVLDEYNKITLQEVIEAAKKVYESKDYVVCSVGNTVKEDLQSFKISK